MPVTVRVSESTRVSLRTIIVIAAAVLLLVPIAFSVAHGASRLNYGKTELSEPLPSSLKDLKLALDTSASVEVRTSETADPSVRLTATGPRDRSPALDISTDRDSSVVSVADGEKFENTKLVVTLPAATAKEMKLDLEGGYGTFDLSGDYREIVAKTDGAAVDIDGSAERLQTSTDYGTTSLQGSFGTIEAKTGVGTLDGTDLSVSDHVDAVTSTGTIDLDFSNDAVPESGIVAKTEEGTIDLQIPRLELAQENMAAEGSDSAKDFFYRINANSSAGEVDLSSELEKYDASKGDKDAEGKTSIPITVSAESGAITIGQN
ncbi:hypothetical protein ACH82I_13295 [Brevibacterium sp. GP-SGM9]|uniref:hypothetical protein n=1 Tax=Brevibacterium sp. GP-SGM9 TaxID=3376990 RepID=UPI0039A514A5